MKRTCIFYFLLIFSSLEVRAATTEFEKAGCSDGDFALIKGAMKKVTMVGQQFFGERFSTLSDKVSLRVVVWGEASEKANKTTATLDSSGDGESVLGTVHLFAPSGYDPDSISMGGLEKRDYCYNVRLLGHEVLSLYFDALSRSKPEGWKYYSAPGWFVQGTQEYVGSMCLEKEARERVLAKYLEQSDIQTSPKIVVSNPYIGGLVLVSFMAENYGEGCILEVLVSEQPSFEEALLRVLDTDHGRLAESFEVWKASRMGR